MLTDEPMVIQIQYVSPDGSVEEGPQYTIGGPPQTQISAPERHRNATDIN